MTTTKIKKARLDAFFEAYGPILERCVSGECPPGTYTYPASEVPAVLGRMRAAIERRDTFQAVNKDSPAIKKACSALSIKHTYRAINEWLMEGGAS